MPGTSECKRFGLALAVLAATAARAQAHGAIDDGHSPSADWEPRDALWLMLPEDQPALGMVYEGLEPAAYGACRGQFRIAGTEQCTHGPDPAPPGIDVKKSAAPVLAAGGLSDAIQCESDGGSGYRVQVIYAHASDVAPSTGCHPPL